MRRALAALAAVLLLSACTPDELAQLDAFVRWYDEQVDTASTTGLPCSEYAGDLAFRALPEHFLLVIWHESRCDPLAVNDSSGSAGLTQIMPDWLPALCDAAIACSVDDLLDPYTNLDAAAYVFAVQGPDAWSSTW